MTSISGGRFPVWMSAQAGFIGTENLFGLLDSRSFGFAVKSEEWMAGVHDVAAADGQFFEPAALG